MGAYCGNSNYTKDEWKHEKHEDGSCSYIGTYTFDINKQRQSNLHFIDRTGAIKVNGVSLYIDGNIMKETIWQDHQGPGLLDVGQVDQAISGDWATIKELTFSGKETLAKIITLTIKDKLTGEIIISGAKASVEDGKFEYKCTPAIEAPVEGRDYLAVMTDQAGNTTEETFTIYRTDSRAPLLVQRNYSEWSQSKTIEIPMTDYGSGRAQTSMGDQVSYKDTVYRNGKYYGYYNYTEENYGMDEKILYLRDGLGNARREFLQIGKIDNTKPTITNIEFYKRNGYIIFDLKVDDFSRKMKKQGSGVKYYALTNSAYLPTVWQETNDLRVNEAGVYYLWVKDIAGNIGDFRVVEVDSNMEVRTDEAPPVITEAQASLKHVSRFRQDKYIYGYYSLNPKTKKNEYSRASMMYTHMFGMDNNDESMYIYLSSSRKTVLSEKQLANYDFNSTKLLNKLKSDPNRLSWDITNTRSVYMIQGNNECYINSNKVVEKYVGNDESRPVYIHIINENGKEYVQEMEVVKRVAFGLH